MAEYITKKAAIKAVENAPIELFQSEWEEIEEAINAAPAADVVPVVHGQWTESKEHLFLTSEVCKEWINFYCSACDAPNNAPTEYCPSCGAKMDNAESVQGLHLFPQRE